MIKVLQNWEEIGCSVLALGEKGIPQHGSPEKCWDFNILVELVEDLPREVEIIDLGCSGLHTLGLLHHLGFERLVGVDLGPTLLDRVKLIRLMLREKSWRRPFKVKRGDMTRTRFADGRFDLATCVSVLEHGVDRERFMAEAGRLLKAGGFLLVTADYWGERIDMGATTGEFNLPWEILAREDVEELVELGRRYGLRLKEDTGVPKCGNRCILWQGKKFTFVGVVFVKE